jgi:hypothetical protein
MKGCRLRITMPASTPLGQPCSSRPRRLPTSRRLPSPLRWIEGGRGPSSSDRVYPYFNRKKFNANQCASWSRGLLPAPRKIRKVRFATSQKTLQFQPDRNVVQRSRERPPRERVRDVLLGCEGAELRRKRPAKRGLSRHVKTNQRNFATTWLAEERNWDPTFSRWVRATERNCTQFSVFCPACERDMAFALPGLRASGAFR